MNEFLYVRRCGRYQFIPLTKSTLRFNTVVCDSQRVSLMTNIGYITLNILLITFICMRKVITVKWGFLIPYLVHGWILRSRAEPWWWLMYKAIHPSFYGKTSHCWRSNWASCTKQERLRFPSFMAFTLFSSTSLKYYCSLTRKETFLRSSQFHFSHQ